jgi:TonB family protein
MATGNNIKKITAADIEKYHKGLLSKKEMHDLEKAALDDPFIADALEGYAVAGQDAPLHLNDLRTRLAQRTEGTKVVPLNERKRKAIPWLRVAALVIVVAGAALLANQLIFKSSKKTEIAKIEKKTGEEIKSPVITDNSVTVSPGTKDETTPLVKEDGGTKGTTTVPHEGQGEAPVKSLANNTTSQEDVVVNNNAPVTTTTNPGSVTTNPPVTGAIDDKARPDDKKLAKEKTRDLAAERKLKTDGDGVKDQYDGDVATQQNKTEGITTTRRAANEGAGYYRNNQTNTFRGQVTDANNVPVPFANVTNAQDNNAGTYADARGNFTLTYPDSVLNVQVRSIGFENRSIQLRNAVPTNQVVLQDDKSLSETVISNQKPNAETRNRNMAMNVKLEEPEPADGWENYDTYLANNLNAPEEIKTKQTSGGQVQVSFEVNKEGEPINIKVEKSLCSKCDKEAIRLVKEGPKWKRLASNKKGRTTVTINF